MDEVADVTFLKRMMIGLVSAALVCCAGLAMTVVSQVDAGAEQVQAAMLFFGGG